VPSELAPDVAAASDSEVVAVWFQRRVMQGSSVRRSGSQAWSRRIDGRRACHRAYVGRLRPRLRHTRRRKLGISLQELDELGDIPYVEQLREEKRFDELSELGFENETVPWPACLRTGTCRLDAKSSPPG
jgi:hypothetical protein